MTYMDREKAKVWKVGWYDAIADTDERAQYRESDALVKHRSQRNNMTKRDVHAACRVLLFLRTHTDEHRLVWKDMARAYACMSPFFSDSDDDVHHDLSNRIADNVTKAQKPPYSRNFQSNVLLTKDFWKEADRATAPKPPTMNRHTVHYDRDSDALVRPIVARWFQAGIICRKLLTLLAPLS